MVIKKPRAVARGQILASHDRRYGDSFSRFFMSPGITNLNMACIISQIFKIQLIVLIKLATSLCQVV